jgi:TusA-related sulfurtransferase
MLHSRYTEHNQTPWLGLAFVGLLDRSGICIWLSWVLSLAWGRSSTNSSRLDSKLGKAALSAVPYRRYKDGVRDLTRPKFLINQALQHPILKEVLAQEPMNLDLRGVPCPLSFVRTKLRLEQMSKGEQLIVWLDPGEAIEQVPNSLMVEGHLIQSLTKQDGFYELIVQRA